MTVNTATQSSAAAAQAVFDHVKASGYFAPESFDPASPGDD